MEWAIAVLIGFCGLLWAAFGLGSRSGNKSTLVAALEAELKLRKRHAEIDKQPDVDDPFASL